jgi:lipoprotein-anchoring transpeptidase ErfK/SrfK
MMLKIAIIALALVAPALTQDSKNYEVSVLNETHLLVRAPNVTTTEKVLEIERLLTAAPAAVHNPAPVVETTPVENDKDNKEQPKSKLVADTQTNVTATNSANVTASTSESAQGKTSWLWVLIMFFLEGAILFSFSLISRGEKNTTE